MAKPTESKAWQNFVKFLGFGGKTLSVLSTAMSLGLGFYSVYLAKEPTQEWRSVWNIIISLIVLNSLLLIAITIYEVVLYIKAKKVKVERDKIVEETSKNESDLNQTIKNKESEIEEYKNYAKFLVDFTADLSKTLHFEFDKIINNNDIFQEKIYDLKKWKAKNQKPREIADFEFRINQEQEDYKKQLIKSFNDFLSVCVNDLKDCIDKIFTLKGLKLKSSITIKLLEDEFINGMDYSDLKVITAFRDRVTFKEHIREIKQKLYTVAKNSDFVHCLTHDYFLRNNIPPNEESYINENKDFSKYYNCALVVPIFYGDSNHRCYYGYLACDTLNQNNENDIFDASMAKIVQYVGHIIGAYLDNIDYQWDAVLETLEFEFSPEDLEDNVNSEIEEDLDSESFLSIIYKMKSKDLIEGASK